MKKMTLAPNLEKTNCYHCGDACESSLYITDQKQFCCQGCQSVYQILSGNGLCSYYQYNDHPGATRAKTDKRFEYLYEPSIISEQQDYCDGHIAIITLY